MIEERRIGYVALPSEFIRRLDDHINEQAKRDLSWDTIIAAGTERMNMIEIQLKPIAEFVSAAKGAVMTSKVVSVIGILFISLFSYILAEKNKNIEVLQEQFVTAEKHTSELLAIVQAHQVVIERNSRLIDRNTTIMLKQEPVK